MDDHLAMAAVSFAARAASLPFWIAIVALAKSSFVIWTLLPFTADERPSMIAWASMLEVKLEYNCLFAGESVILGDFEYSERSFAMV